MAPPVPGTLLTHSIHATLHKIRAAIFTFLSRAAPSLGGRLLEQVAVLALSHVSGTHVWCDVVCAAWGPRVGGVLKGNLRALT